MDRAKLAIVFFLLVLPVWSDVIYTNLGPVVVYDPAVSYTVWSRSYVAKEFTPTASGNLTSIRLPLDANTNGGIVPDLVITLRAPGGDPTGAILETWTIPAAQILNGPTLVVLNSVANPFLTAGTPYWLRLESTIIDDDGLYFWYHNSTGDTGVSTSSDSGATWTDTARTSPALEVNARTGSDFQVRYFANLNVADSLINITNTGANGASLNGPGFGATGNICVNVYAFSPDEQLVSCCSCLITPNGLVSLSVYEDLRANTLTGVTPNSMVVKLLGTATGAGPSFTGTTCNGSAAAAGSAAFPIIPSGSAAWGTTAHVPGAGAVPGAPTPFAITETPFTPATLSPAELASITNRCTNIIGNGSGFGICRSCTLGGRGGSRF